MSDPSSVLYVAFLVALALFAFVLTPKFDRDRICEHIEEHGGKVIEISRVWTWANHNARTYDVSYLTARGRRLSATCRTNMWRGVYWINDRPPGLPDESVPGGEFSRAAETIQCLDCGAAIPESETRCPRCGWSYRAHLAGK
jgi:hypothetical protein